MTHRNWLKMLLDGGKGTSLTSSKKYVYYDENDCAFKYGDGHLTDIRLHKKDLSEYKEFDYPLYFKYNNLTLAIESSLVVKFVGLRKGTVVVAGTPHAKGYYAEDWRPHTKKDFWTQVDKPRKKLCI